MDEREMSLDEYIASKLEVIPSHHRVQREYREQVEKIAELEAELERLKKLIAEHNKATAEACQWMQENRSCSDYIRRGRRCPECPLDWAIDADGVPK